MRKFSINSIPPLARVLLLLGVVFLIFVSVIIFLILKASRSGDSYSGGLAPDGSFCDYGYNYNTQACCDEDDYSCEYRDSRGLSPAPMDSSCLKAGATAKCQDKACSFAARRDGACAHHGGVMEWY
jgi:hypothetical protein